MIQRSRRNAAPLCCFHVDLWLTGTGMMPEYRADSSLSVLWQEFFDKNAEIRRFFLWKTDSSAKPFFKLHRKNEQEIFQKVVKIGNCKENINPLK